jgi:hypothetical protein
MGFPKPGLFTRRCGRFAPQTFFAYSVKDGREPALSEAEATPVAPFPV